MTIFNRNTKKKHIEVFEQEIAFLLKHDFPQFQKVIDISKLYGISFTNSPQGIYISRGYSPEAYNEIQKNHRTHFNLSGISVYNFTRRKFIPLKLNYSFDGLTRIEVEEPKRFHSNFDLKKLKLNKIEIEELPNENPIQQVVKKILNGLTKRQIKTLEIEDSFEIDFDNKIYYTILDMEDGNYIAVDKFGAVYRLNHDHQKRVRKISDKPIEFLTIYNGDKSELTKLMEE